jgi:Sulfotransferase family
MTRRLFVTGCLRSGTSLTDNLLSCHSQILILSQPLQLLYVEMKRRFISENLDDPGLSGNIARHFPLNDLFGENYYNCEAFTQYLGSVLLEPDWFAKVLASMDQYSGRVHKPKMDSDRLVLQKRASFLDFIDHYLKVETENCSATYLGSKEVFAEEYIPYLINNDIKTILVVRDPRDVIASCFSGKGSKFIGAARPFLFVLRQWRKSVAFALRYGQHKNLQILRYEDLVSEPEIVLARIANWLGTDTFPSFIKEKRLRGLDGHIWQSNSSHAAKSKIFTSSVGSYTRLIDHEVRQAIEILCGPEMKLMRYSQNSVCLSSNKREFLRSLDEPYAFDRSELQSYAWNGVNVEREISRLDYLQDGKFVESLHLFRDIFEALADCFERAN